MVVSLSIFIAVEWLSGSKEKKRDRKGKRKLAFKLSKPWFYLISGGNSKNGNSNNANNYNWELYTSQQ